VITGKAVECFRHNPWVVAGIVVVPWLLAQLGFFLVHHWIETDPQEAVSVTVRLFFQTTAWMAFFGLFMKVLGPRLIWSALVMGFLTVEFEIFDTLHQVLAEGMLGFEHRPQNGVIIFAGSVLLASTCLMIFRKTKTSVAQKVTTSLMVMLLLFWAFLHLALVGYTWPKISDRRQATYETALLISDKGLFMQWCKVQSERKPDDFVAKEGWRDWDCVWQDATAEIPEEHRVMGGIPEIHDQAQSRPFTLHAWIGNYTDRPVIDNQVKHIGYFNDGKVMKLIIDKNGYIDTKQIMLGTMHFFQVAFVVVWLHGGMLLFFLHQSWFSRRRSGADEKGEEV